MGLLCNIELAIVLVSGLSLCDLPFCDHNEFRKVKSVETKNNSHLKVKSVETENAMFPSRCISRFHTLAFERWLRQARKAVASG
jgi:hypothetical protein